LARFEREARLLASLNHPNIATIHGLEESDGIHFLVLELVPGETLAEQIEKGPVPVDEALPLFQQIAEALEAAHEKGIIHRDLKPANVKVTPEGKVKVLDFGLAKAFEDEPPVSDLSQSPTLSRGATRAGVILGTAGYMSPEQARGKSVDKRTDVWAFGCCLYETLTGHKSFSGETVTDTLAAVVRAEPDWSALPPDTPWRIRDLLERCLRKDPGMRLKDVGAARLDIIDALDKKPIPVESAGVERQRRGRTLWYGLTALIAAAVAGLAVWLTMQPLRPHPQPLKRFSIPLPPEETWLPNAGPLLSLSPDGTELVYVVGRSGVTHLLRRSLDQTVAKAIPGTNGANKPFFSPDGNYIGFMVDNTIHKMSLGGGPALPLAASTGSSGAACWGPDDTIYFTMDASIWRISVEGGDPQIVVSASDTTPYSRPKILPDGRAILFNARTGSPDTASIDVLDMETGEQRSLIQGGNNPHYAPTGHILFARMDTLFAIPFDAERLEVTGPEVPVINDLRIESGGAAQFAIADDGTLAYLRAGGFETEFVLFRVDRRGEAHPLSEKHGLYRHPRLSPDGRRLAVDLMSEEGRNVWIYEISRDTLTRLTFEGRDTRPVWSPDGRHIAYYSGITGKYSVNLVSAVGGNELEVLTSRSYVNMPTSWSSDGKVLILVARRNETGWDIDMLRREGNDEPEPLLGTRFNESHAVLSPDDRWLAYTSDESGRTEVYVAAFPDLSRKWTISSEGGTEPRWSRSGKELFYRTGDEMMSVAIETEPEFSPGKRTPLFEDSYLMDSGGWSAFYDVTPDDEGFIMIRDVGESRPAQIEVVLNWFEELKHLVPTEHD
jgi:serine/threonine-protein kinase